MDKKIAWVTGATRGIGAAIANVLAAKGFYVIGTATRPDGAAEISQRLGKNGEGHVLNISEPESINQFLKVVNTNIRVKHKPVIINKIFS